MGHELVKDTGAIKAIGIAFWRRRFDLCFPSRSVKIQRIGEEIGEVFNRGFVIDSLTIQIWYAGSDGSPQYGFHRVMAGGVSQIQCILTLMIFQNRIGSCIQQNLTDFRTATEGSEHQQRSTVVILPVYVATAPEMKSNQVRCTGANSHFDEGIHWTSVSGFMYSGIMTL